MNFNHAIGDSINYLPFITCTGRSVKRNDYLMEVQEEEENSAFTPYRGSILALNEELDNLLVSTSPDQLDMDGTEWKIRLTFKSNDTSYQILGNLRFLHACNFAEF